MPEVADVDVAVEPGDRGEPAFVPSSARATTVTLARGVIVGQAVDRIRLAAGEAERRGALARQELERQDAHAHEVGAVDPLERSRP